MKKLQVVLLALVAVLAFSAVAVSTASAETTLLANWLVKGVAVAEGQTFATTSKGLLLLEDSKTPLGKAVVECNGILDGNVGFDGADEVLKVLNSTGTTEIEAALKGTGLLCEGTETCEKDATETEAWPVELPILTLLFLLENGTFTILFYTGKAGGAVGWEIKCLVDSLLIEDECKLGDIQGEALNVTGGVELAEKKSEPGETCTEGGTASGFATPVAGNLTSLTNGEALTMSSEGEEG